MQNFRSLGQMKTKLGPENQEKKRFKKNNFAFSNSGAPY